MQSDRTCPYSICFAEVVAKHNLPACFFVCDKDGRYVMAIGQIAYDMYPDLQTKTCWEIFQDNPKTLEIYRKVFDEKENQKFQIVLQGKLFNIILEPIPEGGCQGVAFESTCDISLKEKWLAVVKTAPFGIATCGDSGQLLEISSKFTEICGYDYSELVNKKYIDLVHEEDRPELSRLKKRLVNGELDYFSSRHRLVRPDGTIVWILLEASYIKSVNEEGENITITFIQDVTSIESANFQLAFDNAIRSSILRQEFELWYQPIVDLKTTKIVGYEALVRWRQNDEIIYPKDFLDNISKDVMPELCIDILKQVTRQLEAWKSNQEYKHCFISMNLAPISMNEVFESMFHDIIEQEGVDRTKLHLEITETDVINTPIIKFILEGMRKRGHSIAIDDFPTGNSNFASLYNFPADIIKIDISLVAGIDKDPAKQRILKAVIALCKSLGFSLIAEGVETKGVAQWLLDNGIHMGQGFLYGKAENFMV